MRAIVILHNGRNAISPHNLAAIGKNIADACTCSIENITIHEFDENDVALAIANPLLTCQNEKIKVNTEDVLKKAVEFILVKYETLIHPIHDVKLCIQIIQDIENNDADSEMVKSCVNILGASSYENHIVNNLGMPYHTLVVIRQVYSKINKIQ